MKVAAIGNFEVTEQVVLRSLALQNMLDAEHYANSLDLFSRYPRQTWEHLTVLLVLADTLGDESLVVTLRTLTGRSTRAPILCIRGSHTSASSLFDAGAAEVVSRPCDADELFARIRRLIPSKPGPPSASCLHWGPLRVDVQRRTARDGERRIDLTPVELDLLIYLLAREGQVVSSELILRDVLKTHGSQNNVKVHVCHLRRKLGSTGAMMIQTVRRGGYLVGGYSESAHSARESGSTGEVGAPGALPSPHAPALRD